MQPGDSATLQPDIEVVDFAMRHLMPAAIDAGVAWRREPLPAF